MIFPKMNVRYVKINVNGAFSYTGEWSSIEELEVICAETTFSIGEELDRFVFAYYLNPIFQGGLRVQIPAEAREQNSSVTAMDILGCAIEERTNVGPGMELILLQDMEAGVYLIRWINESGQLIQTERVGTTIIENVILG